ncbi:MAG: DedA family protein [Actinomycetes bacterium]
MPAALSATVSDAILTAASSGHVIAAASSGHVLAAASSGHVLALGPDWLNPDVLLSRYSSAALVLVAIILFAECGLLIGFFLPGDSLLFTAGLLIAAGTLATPLWLLCVVASAAAILGNLAGYAIGFRAGPRLFRRPDSRLLKQEYVERTNHFFERHGARAIVLARFVPIVRTFIAAMAGVGRMDLRRFSIYSVIGGILWGTGVTLLGHALGGVDFIRNNLEIIFVVVVLVSFIPIVLELTAGRRRARDR